MYTKSQSLLYTMVPSLSSRRHGWSDDLAERTGGKRTVPYMIDPNAPKGSPAEGMFESDDIINYLFETYGNNSPIPFQLKGVFSVLSAGFAALARGKTGI